MSWVAVAIGGSALLGYLGSQNASGAQVSASRDASQNQLNMYNQTRTDQTPWRNAGSGAVNYLSYLMGIPGYQGFYDTPPSGNALNGGGTNNGHGFASGGMGAGRMLFMAPAMNQGLSDDFGGVGTGAPGSGAPGTGGNGFPTGGNGNTYQGPAGAFGSLNTPFGANQFAMYQDPGYQFRLAEGQKALDRSAASRGMLLSGAQLKASDAYNQGMASDEYQNAYNRYNADQTNEFNRLAAISGIGQTSANTLASVGMNTANQMGQNYLGAGNAQAAGWTAGMGALSNGLNAWGNYNMWNSMNNPYGGYNGGGATPVSPWIGG